MRDLQKRYRASISLPLLQELDRHRLEKNTLKNSAMNQPFELPRVAKLEGE
jgi:hypothetical protein